jgi:hypothetical protein
LKFWRISISFSEDFEDGEIIKAVCFGCLGTGEGETDSLKTVVLFETILG